MKKLFTLLSLLLFSAFSFAQLAAFTVTATKVNDETCPNNGAIRWTANGLTPGSTVTYSVVNTADNLVKATVTSIGVVASDTQSVSSLPAGTYKVSAAQSNGSLTNSAVSGNITIANQKVNVVYNNVVVSHEVCGNDGQFNILVSTGRAPFTYQIIDASNNVVRSQTGQPDSYMFKNLTAGTYRTRVIDACGTGVVGEVTILSQPSTFTGIYFQGNYTADCTGIKLLFGGTFGGNAKLPLSIKVSYTNPVTGLPESVSGTNTNMPTIPNFSATVTNLQLQLEITDACGRTVIQNQKYDYGFYTSESLQSASCGSKYLISQRSTVWYGSHYTDSYRINFTSAPAGFDPVALNAAHGELRNNHTYGSSTNPLPAGTYNYQIIDQCGNIKTKSFTITASPFDVIVNPTGNECEVNKATIYGYSRYSHPFSYAKITSAPQAFVDAFGPLPFTVPDGKFLLVNGNKMSFYLNHLPTGNYTMEFGNTCDATVVTKNLSISYNPGTLPVPNVIFNCNNQFKVTNGAWYWQKYYPAQGKWGDTYGNLQTPGSGNMAPMSGMGIDWMGNGPGLYRIVQHPVYYSIVTNNVQGTYYCDPVVLKEFTIGDPLVFTNAYAFQCANGTYDVAISASKGTEALNYAIVSDGTSTATVITNNGNSPIFHGVAGGTYFFRVQDACGNFITRQLTLNQLGRPGIRTVPDCTAGTLKLVVDGVDYLKFAWTKTKNADGTPTNDTTVLSTANILDLGTYDAADAGTYTVRMYTDPALGYCIDNTYDMQLTVDALTNAHAGTGQTVNINYDGVLQSINLFDYLTGTYDGYGTWTETTVPSSALLVGNRWNIAAAAPGTYTFQYSVTPPCGGTPQTATVTINLSKLCYKLPVLTGGTVKDTNFGITALGRAGTSNNANWPMVRKGGWMALEANSKGFVVNRVPFSGGNPVGIPAANFVAGMMVYDSTNNCLKIYNGTIWSCYTTQTCPQ